MADRNDGRIALADIGVVCAFTDEHGRPVTALTDDDPTLETIERFADFLRVTGPPATKDRPKPFDLDVWHALDRLDPASAARIDHHADRWTAQLSLGWLTDEET